VPVLLIPFWEQCGSVVYSIGQRIKSSSVPAGCTWEDSGLSFAANDTDYLSFAKDSSVDAIAGKGSGICITNWMNVGTSDRYVEFLYGVGGDSDYQIFYFDYTTYEDLEYLYLLMRTSKTGYNLDSLNLTYTDRQWWAFIADRPASYNELFINGRSVASDSENAYYSPDDQDFTVRGSGSQSNASCNLDFLVYWKEPINKDALALLYEQPYALIVPVSRPVYFDLEAADTFTSSLYIDALLKKTDVAVTNYIDALLLSSFPINVSIDAILEAVSSKTITTDIDALLKSIALVKTTDVDALLQSVGLEREVYIDAVLKLLGVEKTSHIDALIKKEGVEGITSVDALLSVLNIEKSSYIDALLEKIQSEYITIDALLSIVDVQETISIDAILNSGFVSSISIDALLEKIGIESNVSIDSLLKKYNNEVSINIDAVLQSISYETISTSIDSVLKELNIFEYSSIDALLLRENVQFSCNLSALLSKEQYNTIGIDSLLLSLFETSTSIDSVLKKTILANIVIDAQIKGGSTKFAYIDSLLSKVASIQFNIDSILTGARVAQIDIDALLRGTFEALIDIDAMLITSGVTPRFIFYGGRKGKSFSTSRKYRFTSIKRDTV